jgi:hypothetical protein
MKQGQEGVGKLYASIPSNIPNQAQSSKVGQVVGIIMGENLPTPTQYQRAGGSSGIGSVLYLEINTKGPIPIDSKFDDTLYNTCKIAKPFSSTTISLPLIGEIIYIIDDLPSANSEIEKTAIKSYYLGTINAWGSSQLNSVDNSSPGITFKQNPKVKNLLPFECRYSKHLAYYSC